MLRIELKNKLIGLFVLLISGNVILSQGLINNGATITLDNGPFIYIDGNNGDFTNASGDVEVNTSATIQLEGDWVNNDAGGVFTNYATDPADVQFKGAGAQSVGGTQTTNFSTFTLDNSSGLNTGVTLNVPTNVYTSLVTTDGVLNTSTANYLALRNGATATTGNNGSFVDGPLRYHMALSGSRTLNMPLGKVADWRPIELTPTHSAATDYYYTAELFNANANSLSFTFPANITHVSLVHFYTITRSSTSNFTNATVKLYYSTTDGKDDGVTDRTNLGVVKDDGSGNWVDITSGAGTANGTGNITSAAYTPQDTYYSLANLNGGTNPLPISLLEFKGRCSSNGIMLNWSTASETENAFFTIERSLDGTNYEVVGTVPGAGNSNTILKYSHVDEKIEGAYYYRLSQTDHDGKSETFEPVYVDCSSNLLNKDVVIFPNPTRGNFEVVLSNMEGKELNVILRDVLGRVVYSNIRYMSSNSEVLHYDISSLAKGSYLLMIADQYNVVNQKVILN